MAVMGALLVALLCASASSAQPGPVADASLLPPDGFAPGWKKSGTPRVFASGDLYGHINGGAEAFLELGFERLTVQRYEGDGGTLGVELYRMTDATAARGVYLSRKGQESRDATLRARHTFSPYQLLLQQDRFFLMVNRLAGGTSTTSAMVNAAAAVVAKLPADTPVAALGLLSKPGLIEGSERIFRGAFGLQAVFTLGDGDMLQLGGRVTAVSGVYTEPTTGTYTLVVADYPTSSAAGRAFEHIRANLDPMIRVVRTQGTRLVFQDYEKKYGVVSVDGRRLEVRARLERPPG